MEGDKWRWRSDAQSKEVSTAEIHMKLGLISNQAELQGIKILQTHDELCMSHQHSPAEPRPTRINHFSRVHQPIVRYR